MGGVKSSRLGESGDWVSADAGLNRATGDPEPGSCCRTPKAPVGWSTSAAARSWRARTIPPRARPRPVGRRRRRQPVVEAGPLIDALPLQRRRFHGDWNCIPPPATPRHHQRSPRGQSAAHELDELRDHRRLRQRAGGALSATDLTLRQFSVSSPRLHRWGGNSEAAALDQELVGRIVVDRQPSPWTPASGGRLPGPGPLRSGRGPLWMRARSLRFSGQDIAAAVRRARRVEEQRGTSACNRPRARSSAQSSRGPRGAVPCSASPQPPCPYLESRRRRQGGEGEGDCGGRERRAGHGT